MAAHQITINPLSGGIGTAPAGVVPYASDMWGVNAVRVPQVGTPSARTQAKAITVGAVRPRRHRRCLHILHQQAEPPGHCSGSAMGNGNALLFVCG